VPSSVFTLRTTPGKKRPPLHLAFTRSPSVTGDPVEVAATLAPRRWEGGGARRLALFRLLGPPVLDASTLPFDFGGKGFVPSKAFLLRLAFREATPAATLAATLESSSMAFKA